jgi:ArsR family transcriptional regulator
MQAKLDDFTEMQQSISLFAKLFSHPARVAIVQLLAQKKQCISGDISKEIPQLNRVTVSQHLQELKNFGIIKGEVSGVKVCYCINEEQFAKYQQLFTAFFADIKTCCGTDEKCC